MRFFTKSIYNRGRQMSLALICLVAGSLQAQTVSTFAVSHLNSGIYFIRISTKGGEVVKRFVKE